MLRILFYLVFILTVALTSAGIILASRLRNNNRSEIFSPLLYYQVFIFTFGFYGIWGQVLIKAFLAAYISPGLFTRFSNMALLMGLPFLVFAWLMLIQFASGISGRKTGGWAVFSFLFGNFSILFILGYFIASKNITEPARLVKNYYILMSVIWSLIASYLIHLPIKGKETVHEYDRKITCTHDFHHQYVSMYTAGVLYFGIVAGIDLHLCLFPWKHISSCIFQLWDTTPISATEPARDLSFEQFCRKFEVSPRETDIVREICNGLSNKEISEKLFISLQTVKDHTHRIYIKTNVRSRVQLINLVKGNSK